MVPAERYWPFKEEEMTCIGLRRKWKRDWHGPYDHGFHDRPSRCEQGNIWKEQNFEASADSVAPSVITRATRFVLVLLSVCHVKTGS